jgi:hypothetical protein
LDRAAKTIAAILLLAGAGLFVWGSDKGFDFTDEGLYLLVYQHPGEFPDSYTSYHRVGAVVSQAFGHNIVALRLAGFAAMALATFYFGFRLSVFLKGCGIPLFEQRGGPVFLHLALQGSVLAAYCWLPPTPNYNTMAGVGMLAFTGATLSFFSPRAGFRGLIGAVAALALAAAGFLLVFLAKGSSAVGIAIVSAVLLGFCGLIGIRQKAAFAACATGMVLAVAGFIFLLSPELFRSWEFFLASVAALLQGGGAAGMISRHWGEAVNFAVRHLDVYTVPLLIALAVGLFARLPLFSRDPARKGHLVFWGVAAALVAEVVLIAVRQVQSHARLHIAFRCVASPGGRHPRPAPVDRPGPPGRLLVVHRVACRPAIRHGCGDHPQNQHQRAAPCRTHVGRLRHPRRLAGPQAGKKPRPARGVPRSRSPRVRPVFQRIDCCPLPDRRQMGTSGAG